MKKAFPVYEAGTAGDVQQHVDRAPDTYAALLDDIVQVALVAEKRDEVGVVLVNCCGVVYLQNVQ